MIEVRPGWPRREEVRHGDPRDNLAVDDQIDRVRLSEDHGDGRRAGIDLELSVPDVDDRVKDSSKVNHEGHKDHEGKS